MPHDRFRAWRRRRVATSHRELADTIRQLIYRAEPALFDLMDFEDDEQFLHPLLFAYFTDPTPVLPLSQVVYGLLPAERRPASIYLQTDARGRAALARVGDVETTVVSGTVELQVDEKAGVYRLFADGQATPFHWAPPLVVPGSRIEVLRHGNPLITRLLRSPEGKPAECANATRDHFAHLLLAAAVLRDHCPEVWRDIVASTRLIVLFEAPGANSFATLSAHGAAFCSSTPADDEVALVEDLAHQCGHVTFNALTVHSEEFLVVPASTPLIAVTGEAGEQRRLYSAFHALFTYAQICQALGACWDRRVFAGRQAHEVLGRLGFTLAKFRSDLERLNRRNLFTPAGWRCFAAIAEQFDGFAACYGELVGRYDYTNQPYVFSYERFAERNGGYPPVALGCAA
jgi:HEXXH motif-containing protein